jgi:hypothetical protein
VERAAISSSSFRTEVESAQECGRVHLLDEVSIFLSLVYALSFIGSLNVLLGMSGLFVSLSSSADTLDTTSLLLLVSFIAIRIHLSCVFVRPGHKRGSRNVKSYD